MSGGPADLVDCVRLGRDGATLERVFALRDLPRLADVLTDPRGEVSASYEFGRTEDAKAGVRIAIRATPMLQCQRCLQPFGLELATNSEIEFASDESAAVVDGAREPYVMQGGTVSLRDLAEEELILALPVAPACNTPETCGRAPSLRDVTTAEPAGPTVRPFSGLQDLLKKPR
jgi:uncharacterized protein